jgi:copper(I)-binding protein
MKLRSLALAGLSTIAVSSAAMADIEIVDSYARSSGMMAMAGAAFFEIRNTGEEDDRLIGAKADVSKKVELHTHIDAGNGVMKMREVEGGFPVAAGESHMLARGGDHVMFLGLTTKFEQGMTFPLTLIFEKAGEITVEVPVDLERQGVMNHGMMNKSN